MNKRTLIAVGLIAATPVRAQQPRLTVQPAQPAPGAIVRLILEPAFPATDSILSIDGAMAGEPLHFRRSGNVWHALGAVPVDAVGSVAVLAVVTRGSGETDSVTSSVTLPKPKPSRGRARPRALAVAPRFTQPMDSATEARIASENQRARAIGRQAHSIPAMWNAPFLRPRTATVTSRFGSGRMFNGTLTSRHLGVDFRGGVGAPVRAANRGIVALVDDFYLAGNVVYIDHGAGVVTGYFHLIKSLVAEGDTVARGQEIGLVGATGRVTGPHLHWTARYGALTVNPLDLVSLGEF
ncbi:MAG: M23 family metallopeptidase [Gemmatimonadales bacterium]